MDYRETIFAAVADHVVAQPLLVFVGAMVATESMVLVVDIVVVVVHGVAKDCRPWEVDGRMVMANPGGCWIGIDWLVVVGTALACRHETRAIPNVPSRKTKETDDVAAAVAAERQTLHWVPEPRWVLVRGHCRRRRHHSIT